MIRDKQNYCIFGSFFATEKKNDCTASAKSIKSDLRVTLVFYQKEQQNHTVVYHLKHIKEILIII